MSSPIAFLPSTDNPPSDHVGIYFQSSTDFYYSWFLIIRDLWTMNHNQCSNSTTISQPRYKIFEDSSRRMNRLNHNCELDGCPDPLEHYRKILKTSYILEYRKLSNMVPIWVTNGTYQQKYWYRWGHNRDEIMMRESELFGLRRKYGIATTFRPYQKLFHRCQDYIIIRTLRPTFSFKTRGFS